MGKKILIVLSVVLVVFLLFGGGYFLGKRSNNNSEEDKTADAEKNEEHRYLSINNETEEVINLLRIRLEDGTEIFNRANPDEKSVLVPIDDAYKKYSSFTVELEDNYGRLYRKQQGSIPEIGRTAITITKEDRVEQAGDFWKDASDWFNDTFGGKE